MIQKWVTVVEHTHYLKKAEKLLSQHQIEGIANTVAVNPFCGELMQGT